MLTEKSILDKSYEILFGMDEIIAPFGLKESNIGNVDSVKRILKMESQEEILAKIKQDELIVRAKKEAKKKAEKIRQEKKLNPSIATSYRGGISSDDYSYSGPSSFDNSSPTASSTNRTSFSSKNPPPPRASESTSKSGSSQTGGGWNLKKLSKNPEKNLGAELELLQEQQRTQLDKSKGLSPAAVEASAASASNLLGTIENVVLKISEKISASQTRDGIVEHIEIKGLIHLGVSDPESAMCKIHIKKTVDDIKFTVNPKINRDLFNSSGVLVPKDSSAGFPVGKNLELLRWTSMSRQPAQSLLPISLTVWPSEESVSVEYSLSGAGSLPVELHNVVIQIPLPSSCSGFDVSSCPIGSTSIDANARVLNWSIPLARSDDAESANATLEVSFESSQSSGDEQQEAFFPIRVGFHSSGASFSGLDCSQVSSSVDGTAMRFSREITTDGDISVRG